MQKTKPVKDLQQLRLKMAEKMAAFENGELSASDSKVYIGFGSVILKSVAVEAETNHYLRIVRGIDFLDYEYHGKELPAPQKGLMSEIFEQKELSAS